MMGTAVNELAIAVPRRHDVALMDSQVRDAVAAVTASVKNSASWVVGGDCYSRG
jgi:hypothetical protein